MTYDTDGHGDEADAFLDALASHLSAPSGATWSALRDAAGPAASARRAAASAWASDVDVTVGPLLAGEEATWARLLGDLATGGADPRREGRLRDLSPFSGKDLVFVTESAAGPLYAGDVPELFARAVAGLPAVGVRPGQRMVLIERRREAAPPPEVDAEAQESVGC
jgi:hypothetical protein